MNDRLFTLNERLHLGIEAARADQNNLARDHLLAVLKYDPNHIAALLWLAFVLPSPRESIRVLEQALALDPQNEQAKVGLHWARGRLGLNPDAPDLDKGPTPSVSPQTVPVPNPDTIRQNLPFRTAPKEASRTGLVRQARYAINPLLTLILAAVLGLVALGLGALIFMPPDTLAAWLPVSTPAIKANIASLPAANPTLSPVPVIKSFASEAIP